MSERLRLSDGEITDLLRRRSARPAPDALAATILESLASERSLRPVRIPSRSPRRPMVLLAAAALVVVGGVVAVGSGILRQPSVVPPAPAPSSGPVAVPSSEATSPRPSESAPPTAVPTPTATPITWTQASLKQDWPAPVRPEPAGGAGVVPMPPAYIDPSGDTGPDAVPYIDIRDVTANTDALGFSLMSKPPDVDPSKAWIAYGVVVDEDRDGVPDWRYGIDNLPAATAKDAHRAWRTDLHTGRTEFDPNPRTNGWGGRGDPLLQVGDTRFGTGYPAGAFGAGPRFRFYYTSDVAGGGELKSGARQDKPFYVWASAIVDGRVVATDYAPDTGWLVPPTDGTNPGGTYVVDPRLLGRQAPFHLSLNVPGGWIAAGPSIRPTTGEAGLDFLSADHPAEWACDASARAIKPPVGPTVDDLVTFLAHQPMLKISANTDVTLAGYRGKYLEYTTSFNENNNCQPAEWPFGRSAFHRVWILDVAGVRLVIDASAPKASDPVKAELTRIVESIAIGP